MSNLDGLPIYSDGKEVFIDLPKNQRIRLLPGTARLFAEALLLEASKVEGKEGQYLIAEFKS